MALGEKLGSVFGAIGSGLSFIPGPWSALGAVFGAAGGIASSVAKAKQGEPQQESQQFYMPESPDPVQDPQRPQQAQQNYAQPQMPTPQPNRFQSQQGRLEGSYRQQMDDAISNLIVRGLGGPNG